MLCAALCYIALTPPPRHQHPQCFHYEVAINTHTVFFFTPPPRHQYPQCFHYEVAINTHTVFLIKRPP